MDIRPEIDAALRAKVLRVYEILAQMYGEPRWRPRETPIDELIGTILSQNTSDVNSSRAYRQLCERFPSWEEVRDAPMPEVAEAIRSGGLAYSKAPRIQAVLRRISTERGSFDLSFLRELPVEEARAWLLSLEGVGPKTAAIVLLFSLGVPAFPVDTHVHRLSLRLGLVSPKTTAERASELLEMLIPTELYYPLHINLIRHGREICKAQRPRHELCPLTRDCDYYQLLREQAEGGLLPR